MGATSSRQSEPEALVGFGVGATPPGYSAISESWYNPKLKKGLTRSKSTGAAPYLSTPTLPYGYGYSNGTANGRTNYMPYVYPQTYVPVPTTATSAGPTTATTAPTATQPAQTQTAQPRSMPQPEVPVAPTQVPIPDVPPAPEIPPVSSGASVTTSSSSSATSEGMSSPVGGSIMSGSPNPLSHNPLPEPPREAPIPPHLIHGTAITLQPPNFTQVTAESLPPLRNPLPPPPKDMYSTPKYRSLAIGSAYSHSLSPDAVYPDDWFHDHPHRRHGHRREGSVIGSSSGSSGVGLSRGAAALSRRVTKTVKKLAHGLGVGGSLGSRRRRRRGSEPLPFPGPFPGSPNAGYLFSPPPTAGSFYPVVMQMPIPPATAGMGPPAAGAPAYAMPQAQATGNPITSSPLQPQARTSMPPLTAGQGPAVGVTAGMTSPISPNVQLLRAAPIRFERTGLYAGFALESPHSVLYKKKLYATALHLLEAHKFLGIRNEHAERVRMEPTVEGLHVLAQELEPHARRDWAGVAVEKVEEVMYLKFVQHPDLRKLLLDTGLAELIYGEPNDPFWGDGPNGQGLNQLGKALARVRDRLRREGAGK